MYQKIASFIVIASFAFALSATPALAQGLRVNLYGSASTTPIKVRADIRAEMEAKRASSTARVAEMKAQAQARMASSTAKRVEMQRGLAKRKAENTSRVLTATVERLEKIITRLEARLEKVEAAGGNTTEAEAFIAEAKHHLSAAKVSIALFASVDLTGDKAQENFERVKVIAVEAKEHIREAHRSLMEAIRSLGKIRSQVEINTTSTVQ